MARERRDCVVIGGGPAGSTFAAIVRKYAPDTSVTLLERARFPRWHIGESTIPVANAVLRDLEVFDTLEGSPEVVKKIGVTYIWGRDREPWNADFLQLRDVNPDTGAGRIIDVVGQDFSELMRRFEYRDTPFTAFNVRRDVFDAMLLDRARALGAEVREGTRATAVRRDAAGVVEAVEWADEDGRTGVIETPFVLDAAGLNSLLTRGRRVHDPTMNNFAVHGYLRNAGWKVTFNGTRERTMVFIATVDHGWIWYFPIAEDVMSVGAVTHTRHFKDRLRRVDLEGFFWEMLRACPEVATLIEGAELRDDVLPGGRRVAASRDWSSWAEQPVGPGWAAAGDAAVFVDPILSSGVTLALQSGHRAAYTFNTARAHPDLPTDELWRAYADYVREEAGSFLTLARYFYGNNRAVESWWWEAHRVLHARGRLDLSSRQAFTLATAGFLPTLRAVSAEVIAPLVAHLSEGEVDPGAVCGVFHDDGVPPAEALPGRRYRIEAPFRLALRTQPTVVEGRPTGRLDTYHDLVTDDPRFTHRRATAPSRIAPGLAPVVEAMGRFERVDDLLEAAPGLVTGARADAVRRATLAVLRVAALKGFVQLDPG